MKARRQLAMPGSNFVGHWTALRAARPGVADGYFG